MKGNIAGWLFVGVCLILAALLVTCVIDFIVSAVVFAVALVVLGIASRGFRRT